jgi:hypothetical protein
MEEQEYYQQQEAQAAEDASTPNKWL